MRDEVRGVVAAGLVGARRAGTLPAFRAVLEALSGALVASEDLRRTLTDSSVPVAERRGVVVDLLRERGSSEASDVAAFAAACERPAELPAVLTQIEALVADEMQRADAGQPPTAEPPAGRAAVRDRLHGFAELTLGGLSDVSEVDEIEDELFRVARLIEEHPDLEAALTDPELPLAPRDAVLRDLIHGKVRPATEDLLAYVLRAGKVRSLVRTIDWMVELTARERGRRIAEVRTAVELDGAQRERLAAALGRATGRAVELRVIVDPGVIGGMTVSLGDTVIDGTVRHRLAQLREVLGAAGSPAA